MDSLKRKTLELIEEAAPLIPAPERGRQLLLVARDYVDDGEVACARLVLAKVEASYFSDYLPGQALDDREVATALATLIEVFGLDLNLCRQSPARA